MITEDYVSFETAKLLKEKGFDEYCQVWYGIYQEQTQLDEDESNTNSSNKNALLDCACPTLQMACKWLREVHNIHISVDIHWLHFANQNGWMYIITKILENGTDYIDSKGDENDKHFYSTYEEACEMAIRCCLENLI